MNIAKNSIQLVLLIFVFISLLSCENKKTEWVHLFNGKDLSGWQANENPESFKVVDGVIVANGNRSHLFYTGEIANADFKNFELKADVMTHYLANSGIYFHTKYQKDGWPEKGYEVQVNNTHKGGGDYREVKKTGSLYSIKNVYKAFAKDSTWFTLTIRVVGKHITVKVDDTLVVDYVEPEVPKRSAPPGPKIISTGTFALQGHDPDSKVYFKNIKVRMLASNETDASKATPEEPYAKIVALQTDHFPVIDMEVIADESLNIDSALSLFYKSGINLGVVMDMRGIEKGRETAALMNHIKKYNEHPVFTGLKIYDPEVLKNITPETIQQVDYVVAEFITPEDSSPNKELFMDNYVNSVVDFIMKGKFNVWAKVTSLPASIASDYDKLWTKERMLSVIRAANEKGIAIEINEKLQLPSIAFIKLAKEQGSHFTAGDLNIADVSNGFDYYVRCVEECKLVYKDIYIPGTIE